MKEYIDFVISVFVSLVVLVVVGIPTLIETIMDADTRYIRDKKWYDYL